MSATGTDAQVCSECIGDKVLKDFVLSEGEPGQCTFCGTKANCLALENLANQVHEVIEKNFYLTSNEPEGLDYHRAKEGLWERPGEQVHLVISSIAKVSEDIAEAIRDRLSEQFGYEAARDGEEDPYGYDALYEENSIEDWRFQESWDFFKRNIKTRSRFFSQQAEKALDEISKGSIRSRQSMELLSSARFSQPMRTATSIARVSASRSENSKKFLRRL